jgi:glycosyltransferase involved in cell wall biosynthesis
MGRPVIASPAGGVSEIVEDGRTGVIVPPGDPVAGFSAAVDRLLTSPALAGAMGAAGRRIVEERFGIETCADAYDRIYREVAARCR